jgi:ADP-ribose pyrophosphatase YjhB (NUDIX family)
MIGERHGLQICQTAYAGRVHVPVPILRFGYRTAYAALRVYWFLRRPEVRGVKCVITNGGRVLLVRHTYGPRGWDLPGGTVKRGESPVDAASREMNEELGVSIADWRPIGLFKLSIDHRRDRLHCFQAELHAPKLQIARAELADAGWFSRDELPRNLGRYTRPILARTPD